MSAYLPDSHDSEVFRSRSKPDGVYDFTIQLLEDPKYRSLADAEYDRDFQRRKPLDSWSGSYTFLDSKGKELVLSAVGEILGSDYGTALGALGNHFVGSSSSPNLLTDTSKPKHVLALGKPSFCTKKMKTFWYNQVVTLETLLLRDKEIDENAGKSFQVKEPYKSLEAGQDPNVIYVVSGPIYEVPKDSAGAARYRKKRRYEDDTENKDAKDGDKPVESDTGEGPLPLAMLPPDDSVKLGARYDRRVFRDYGGKIFAQRVARVIQQDFRDSEGSLIGAWGYIEKLRPGTFVLLALAPVVWITRDKNGSTRKTYHFVIRSLRVMGVSDAPPEIAIVVQEEEGEVDSEEHELSLAFRSLSVPLGPTFDQKNAGPSGQNEAAPAESQDSERGDASVTEEGPAGFLVVEPVDGDIPMADVSMADPSFEAPAADTKPRQQRKGKK
ncbi:hypothetical protein VNI00_010694 [Paramarasmius palmivorus]|uniref:Uncharacterized protein n=1 Tax=Paramarasmius palmivorus TaxID=297713 RepID=A0AAW0CG59_9AGAR